MLQVTELVQQISQIEDTQLNVHLRHEKLSWPPPSQAALLRDLSRGGWPDLEQAQRTRRAPGTRSVATLHLHQADDQQRVDIVPKRSGDELSGHSTRSGDTLPCEVVHEERLE